MNADRGLLVACLLLAGCSAPPDGLIPADEARPVGDFSLTERGGKTVSNTDLHGKAWIASFVFTRCTGPCPQITGTVARLQKELEGQNDVRFVTFTVDPEHDDPGELRRYAESFGADPARWLFLTGKQEEIYRLLLEGFKVGVQQSEGKDRKPGNEVTHSTRLVLVDRRGHIRGYFDGQQVDERGQSIDDVPRLKEALAAVLREKP